MKKKKTEKVIFKMDLLKFDDNGYPEYFLFSPGSSTDGKLIKKVEATIEVSPSIAEKIGKSLPF